MVLEALGEERAGRSALVLVDRVPDELVREPDVGRDAQERPVLGHRDLRGDLFLLDLRGKRGVHRVVAEHRLVAGAEDAVDGDGLGGGDVAAAPGGLEAVLHRLVALLDAPAGAVGVGVELVLVLERQREPVRPRRDHGAGHGQHEPVHRVLGRLFGVGLHDERPGLRPRRCRART